MLKEEYFFEKKNVITFLKHSLQNWEVQDMLVVAGVLFLNRSQHEMQ